MAPWYLGPGIAAAGLAAAAFAYAYRRSIIDTPATLFGASMVAEIFGAVVIYTLLHSLFRRDLQSRGQQVFEIGGSVFLFAIVIAALFY